MAITREEELLIEEASTAYRPVNPDGSTRLHPAWADLSPEARATLFDETVRLRTLERALDPAGLSSTAKAILARVRRG